MRPPSQFSVNCRAYSFHHLIFSKRLSLNSACARPVTARSRFCKAAAGVTIEEIIQKFAAKETLAKAVRAKYSYTQSISIQELSGNEQRHPRRIQSMVGGGFSR